MVVFDPVPTSEVQVFVDIKNQTWRVVNTSELSGGALNDVFGPLAQVIVGIFQETPVRFSRIKSSFDPIADEDFSVVEAEATVLASPPLPYNIRDIDGSSVLAQDMRLLVPAQNFDPDSSNAVYDMQLRR